MGLSARQRGSVELSAATLRNWCALTSYREGLWGCWSVPGPLVCRAVEQDGLTLRTLTATALRCFPPRFRLPPLLCGFRLRFRRALPLPPSAAPLPPGGRRKAAEALPLPPPSASAPPSLRRATHRPTTRRWRLVELSSAVVGSRGARRAGEVLSAPECSRAEGGSPASAFRFRPASARVFTLPAI